MNPTDVSEADPTVNPPGGYFAIYNANTYDGFVAARAPFVGLKSQNVNVFAENNGHNTASTVDAAKSLKKSIVTCASINPGFCSTYPPEPKFVKSTFAAFRSNFTALMWSEKSVDAEIVPEIVGFAAPGATPVQAVPWSVIAVVNTKVAIVTRSGCYTGLMDKACEICGRAFKTSPSRVRDGNGRFCSRACFTVEQLNRLGNRVERTCEQCGQSFTAKHTFVLQGVARFCSRGCFDLSRRGPRVVDVRYRMMRAKGHPVAPPSGIAPVARVMLYDHLGGGWHPCHWCGRLVGWRPGVGVRDPDALLVDHLDHDPTNDVLPNLVPSCNDCNSHRTINGRRSRIQPGDLTKRMADGRVVRVIERSCELCGGSFLTRTAEVKKGKGRFCSRSCARRAPRSVRGPRTRQ